MDINKKKFEMKLKNEIEIVSECDKYLSLIITSKWLSKTERYPIILEKNNFCL